MYNKTIIRFGFCDILNNQGLGKYYQPQPLARLITLTSTFIIPDITKISSNNCLKFAVFCCWGEVVVSIQLSPRNTENQHETAKHRTIITMRVEQESTE